LKVMRVFTEERRTHLTPLDAGQPEAEETCRPRTPERRECEPLYCEDCVSEGPYASIPTVGLEVRVPAEYFVPNTTRSGGGVHDVEMRLAFVCREHLEERLDQAAGKQLPFLRVPGST
jgi:hypothetical protein